MEFCPKCGSILFPEKKKNGVYLVCRNCGYKTKEGSGKRMKVEEEIKRDSNVIISKGNQEEVMPKTRILCPSCGNNQAYWWMQQTRAADEPPTRFYRCTKCGYTWREYS